jgi:hypothetical protein
VEVDRSRNVLQCAGMCQPSSGSFDEFAAVSRDLTFSPGVGLPGRVWASRQPAWIPDVTRDANFPRAPIARKVGLHAAFGVPVLQKSNVIGVMEFFNRNILEPTPELLAMMTTVGTQVALYVERKWAGDELDRFFTLSLDLFGVATFDGHFIRVNRVMTHQVFRRDSGTIHGSCTRRPRAPATAVASPVGSHDRFREPLPDARRIHKWLQWTAAPLARLIYCAARDVTERRASEDASRNWSRARGRTPQRRAGRRQGEFWRTSPKSGRR